MLRLITSTIPIRPFHVGCTSGHGLTGASLLSLNSLLAIVGMFGSAIAMGFAFRASSMNIVASS